LLRTLGLSAEPADQHDFFAAALGEAFSDGAGDVLICGTVDTALPDLVDEIAAGHRIHLTVIDRCPTPVGVVAGHAARRHSSVETETADILTWQTSRRFDLITTHALFGFIAPEDRPRLAQNWFSLLRPGGRVVTATRLRPDDQSRGFDKGAGIRLADEAARRLPARYPDLDVPIDAFRQQIIAHTTTRRTYPVHTPTEIETLLKNAGFAIRSIAAVLAAPRVGAVPGPAQPVGASYCHVVAERPRS